MVVLLTGGWLEGWLSGPFVGWMVDRWVLRKLAGRPSGRIARGPAEWCASGRLAGRPSVKMAGGPVDWWALGC